ncbi:hypothetical protein BKA62DRAFT_719094 [Auriculariales sp. MPI-PUGE-AT-0066]|nr:hypothetical protein BKA62DRAFT_719094 [Auriculariales sp. MPI-PUGE-AT-0066]
MGLGQIIHGQAHRARERIHALKSTSKERNAPAAEDDDSAVPAYSVDLAFRFIGASGLPAMDFGGTSDPYFTANLDEKIQFTSSVQTKTLAPVWNESWFVRNVPITAVLEVKILDKDDGGMRDDFIGKFKIKLEDGAREVRIESSAGAQMGTMWLEMKLTETREPGETAQYTFDGPVTFSRHFSPTIGLFAGSKDQRPDPHADMDHSKEIKAMLSKGTDSNQDPPIAPNTASESSSGTTGNMQAHPYSTWKFHLKGVAKFFGDKHQHWLESYPAAQKIFQGPGLLRVSIRSAHRVLYARTTMNQFGMVNSADDLWQELAPQERSTDSHSNPTRHANVANDPQPRKAWKVKPVMYTYIIGNDDMLRFSETGAAFFTDFASKHALHACCAETVRYSGEFHARPCIDGGWGSLDGVGIAQCDWELLIDNSSGTYGPDKELLPALQKTLEYNFPGLRVRAFDFKDAELKRSKDEMDRYAKKHTRREGDAAKTVETDVEVTAEEIGAELWGDKGRKPTKENTTSDQGDDNAASSGTGRTDSAKE